MKSKRRNYPKFWDLHARTAITLAVAVAVAVEIAVGALVAERDRLLASLGFVFLQSQGPEVRYTQRLGCAVSQSLYCKFLKENHRIGPVVFHLCQFDSHLFHIFRFCP